MRLFSLIAALLLSNAASADKPVAVLVPGFFNSLADGSAKGPYFSANIVETVEAAGYDVVVVNNLAPRGGIKENTRRLTEFLKNLSTHPAAAEYGLTLIAHSAGGLYSMKALTADPTLPVRALATISTPYSGVDFVSNLSSSKIIRTLAKWFGLEALMELTGSSMKSVMQSIHVPDHVRVVVAGGEQKSCLLVTCAQAERLSWLLTISGSLSRQISDGIVGYESSLSYPGSAVRMTDKISLEHWEQVLDYRTFSLLGVVNPGYVRDEQRRFYTALMELLR